MFSPKKTTTRVHLKKSRPLKPRKQNFCPKISYTFLKKPTGPKFLISYLWDAMLLHWSPSTSHPTFTQGSRRFPQGWQVSQGCASAHMLRLLATNLIDNSGLIFKYVKIINVFACGKEFMKKHNQQPFHSAKDLIFFHQNFRCQNFLHQNFLPRNLLYQIHQQVSVSSVIYLGIFFSLATYLHSSKNTCGKQFLPVRKTESKLPIGKCIENLLLSPDLHENLC